MMCLLCILSRPLATSIAIFLPLHRHLVLREAQSTSWKGPFNGIQSLSKGSSFKDVTGHIQGIEIYNGTILQDTSSANAVTLMSDSSPATVSDLSLKIRSDSFLTLPVVPP